MSRTTLRRNSRPSRNRSNRRPHRRNGRRRGRQLTGSSRRIVPVCAVAAIVALALIAFIVNTTASQGGEVTRIVRHLVYTAPTANDAVIALPDVVVADLREIGRNHQKVELTRVDSTGQIENVVIDMTPREGVSPDSPVLKVPERAEQAITKIIKNIVTQINTTAASGPSRALYSGLTKTDFTTAPVTIVSSGLDLADPDDFRKLNWTVSASEVATGISSRHAQASLHSDVTFVVIPSVGAQPQLGQTEKSYRNQLWTTLLTAAGATHVTFLDGTGTAAAAATPAATVDVPHLPGTPIQQVPVVNEPSKKVCPISANYFQSDLPNLINTGQTITDLTPCITTALSTHATFELDAWTSYDGPLDANGKPAIDSLSNKKLAKARANTIRALLIDQLHVPAEQITRVSAHGNVDQPNPDPRSPQNRLVRITYTTK